MEDDKKLTAGFLSVIGTFGLTIALIFMKFGHQRVQKSKGNVLCDKFWILGLICITLGYAMNIFALRYGSQVLLASRSSFSIIFNTMLSVTCLKEALLKSDLLSICLLCVGSIAFMLEAKNDDVEYSTEELLQMYIRPHCTLFYLFLTAFVGYSFYANN